MLQQMMLTAVEWPAARRNTAIPHWLTGLAHWAVVSSIRRERIHILQTPDAEYQVKQVHVAFVAGDKRWFKRLLGCPSCIECVSVGVLKVRWSENNSGHLGTKKDGRTKLQETAMHKMHNLCQIIKPQIYHESSPIFTDLHQSSPIFTDLHMISRGYQSPAAGDDFVEPGLRHRTSAVCCFSRSI